MSLHANTLLTQVRNYAHYRRTLRELNGTAMSTRFDFDIYSGDFDKMAHKAVYGV